MVTAEGREIDGDEILYIIARQRLAAGTLSGPVVGTQMSNLGLEQALRKLGLDFQRAAVGDRYVMEILKAKGGMLGGETSGHTICLDRTSTGDGTVTALQVLSAMVESGQSLAQLAAGMHKLPQVLINVRIHGAAKPLLAHPGVRASVAAVEQQLAARGRVLLRASGTEPLIRVMVEVDDAAQAQRSAETIAEAVRQSALLA